MTRVVGRLLTTCLLTSLATAGAAQTPGTFTRADTLRGSFTTPGRAWWDVTYYDLNVSIQPADSTIRGYNIIAYTVLEPATEMQIDLMTPLVIDSIVQDGRSLPFRRDGNAFFVTLVAAQTAGATKTITIHYHGAPRTAPRPPWDGGFTWTADSLGRPWIVTTDQGLGASVWWPNKDTQAEEPDSQRVALTVPSPLVHVGNGRLRSTTQNPDGTTTYEWFVSSPINNYAINVNAGNYVHWNEVYEGEKGPLTMDFWPLDYHLDAAKRQWVQARSMMKCFEHWFGPYPWYEDGFKLIDVPYNGMEHQSAVTYGNRFANGYVGRDASGTGLGMEFDFIIVHESAHEWFANNITAKDQADMWVHESFANYAEGLYVECLKGKEAGSAYIVGTRRGIRNDRPIVPDAYGVNAQGSGDMYPKGGNMLHTIRQIIDDDEKWRGILRGLNETFGRQTVMGAQIQEYISEHAGTDLSRVFDQYLRTTQIPVLEYRIDGDTLHYRWTNVVAGFDMPVRVTLAPGQLSVIRPTEAWQSTPVRLPDPAAFEVDVNFYVTAKNVTGRIIDRPVPFPAERIELTREYIRDHYGMEVDNIEIVPRIIVLHWTAGRTLEGDFNTFVPSRLRGRADIAAVSQLNVGIQFLVDRDGTIYRLMPETWMARHVIGLNYNAIGVENVGSNDLTPEQRDANIWLVRYLARKYSTIEYLIGHHEYRSFEGHELWLEKDDGYRTVKSDPGDAFMSAVRDAVSDLRLKGPATIREEITITPDPSSSSTPSSASAMARRPRLQAGVRAAGPVRRGGHRLPDTALRQDTAAAAAGRR